MEQEIWKPVKGLDGEYEVSNMARIRTVEYVVVAKDGRTMKILPRIKKQVLDHHGYLYVKVKKDGKQHSLRVHRAIMEAFVENPENKPFIDHINTIRTDDRVENLKWVTHKENTNNPKTIKNSIVGATIAFKSQKIYVYDTTKSKNGKCVFTFLSPKTAARYFGVSYRIIIKALDNANKRVCGYLIRSERKRYKTKSK